MKPTRWTISGAALLAVTAGVIVYRPTDKVSLDIANGLIRRERRLTIFGVRRAAIEQTWLSRRLTALQHPKAPPDWRLITLSEGGLLWAGRCGYGEAGPIYSVLTDLGQLDAAGLLSPQAASLVAVEVVERWRAARDPEACLEPMTSVWLAADAVSPLTVDDVRAIFEGGRDRDSRPGLAPEPPSKSDPHSGAP